jgi:hypothetical protein
LRVGLSRRGVELSAVGLGAVIAQNATAAVPQALRALTTQTSLAGAGPAGTAGPLAPPIVTLVKVVLHDMFLTKLKRAVAMVLVVCVAGLGGGAIASLARSGSEPVRPDRPFAAPGDATPEKKPEEEQEKDKPQDGAGRRAAGGRPCRLQGAG